MIVVDAPKRLANLKKHRLDQADFEEGFDFETAVEFPASPSRTGRTRFGLIGWLNGTLVVVAIMSPLGTAAVSIVNLRSASDAERKRYGFR